MFTIWLFRELRAERVLAGADALFERGRSAGRELALDEAVSAGLTSVD